MLANCLSWSPNSEQVVYSRIVGEERRVYIYDKNDEVSFPISYQNPSKWFEFEFIHQEQILIHNWENGFIVYDIEEKHSQLMLKEESAISFNFQKEKKELVVSTPEETFLFLPKSREKKVIAHNAREFIIDSLHHTFITVNNFSELNIFFKNESIFSHKLVCGIYLSENSQNLLFFTENEFTILNLESLEIESKFQINGSVQNANLTSSCFHFTTEENNSYSLYVLSLSKFDLNLVKTINHEDQLFTALSPCEKHIAISSDLSKDTNISVISL